MVSKDGTKYPVRLSIGEWIAIITLGITLLGIGWRFSDGVKEELAKLGERITGVETKVDMMLRRQIDLLGKPQLAGQGIDLHDAPN